MHSDTAKTELDVGFIEGSFFAGKQRVATMLGWALTFLIVAIVAGFLGFGGIAGAATGIAQILFFVFVALLAVSLLVNLVCGRGH